MFSLLYRGCYRVEIKTTALRAFNSFRRCYLSAGLGRVRNTLGYFALVSNYRYVIFPAALFVNLCVCVYLIAWFGYIAGLGTAGLPVAAFVAYIWLWPIIIKERIRRAWAERQKHLEGWEITAERYNKAVDYAEKVRRKNRHV